MHPPSVLNLFNIGLGPSSSHTLGPMRAAALFRQTLASRSDDHHSHWHLNITLHGSLAATGEGHGTPRAIVAGLCGLNAAVAERNDVETSWQQVNSTQSIIISQHTMLSFNPKQDFRWVLEPLPLHANGITFVARSTGGTLIEHTVYSTGGGTIADERGQIIDDQSTADSAPPFLYRSAAELIDLCRQHGLSIAQLVRLNEGGEDDAIDESLRRIWRVMRGCIDAGLRTEGTLPGGLKVKRRAPGLWRPLESSTLASTSLEQRAVVYAMAVNEENAAGGRVVTAPTNGAAGIVPAVLAAHLDTLQDDQSRDQASRTFLLTAAAIGGLFKMNASISGAEVGCQGEVGSAASMAAAGLAAVMGGSPAQIENAAEIAIEHCLGLTCDPIGGLVQVPCIERNGMGAVKAITAARIALAGDGEHLVSLDQAIETMRDTGRDMHHKYKETALGGLAVTGPRIPVATIEC